MRNEATRWSGGRIPPLDLSNRYAVIRDLLLPLTLCILLPSTSTLATAQRGSAMHSAPANFHAPKGNHAVIGHFRHSYPYGYSYGVGYPGYASLPFPFFGDDFDPNNIYSTGYPVSSAPPPYLIQALQGLVEPAANSASTLMAPQPNRESSSNDPLMIELQNGRYVRVNGPVINSDAEPINFPENSQPAKPYAKAAKAAPQPAQPQDIAAALLPPVTLVFRDGHKEEVRDYTIVQGTLYARGDYYADGYWNKKIDLATLNVPATLEANAASHVKFVLPSSLNEVVTRP